jgi:hypothetical protein
MFAIKNCFSFLALFSLLNRKPLLWKTEEKTKQKKEEGRW